MSNREARCRLAGPGPQLTIVSIIIIIRKVQETRLVLDMNGTHQVLTYASDVNLMGDNIRIIERNAEVLLNVCKRI